MIKSIKTGIILLAALLLAWLLPWCYAFVFASPSWSPFTLYSCVTHGFASVDFDRENNVAGRDLQGNTYTQQALCPGNHRLMAAREDVQRRYVSKDEGQSFAVGTEPVQYFRVSEGSGGVAAIAPASAQAAGGSLRQLQTLTVPRVVATGCASA